MLLPFQTITLEISARARPTTLDLAIAVFSGLVGAVVTVARGSRLSAAIPGVAISVALIPPLAVAGFGIGAGWNWELIKGSMLLYGANLAGIVLSGMGVFLLVGMHRSDVVETARGWHGEAATQGLAAWADRVAWVRSLGVFQSAWARVGLVAAFAVALGIPLTTTLSQIAREARVERAVSEVAEDVFGNRERASILSRQVVYGSDRTQVYLRVATTRWFDGEARVEFERAASARAEEPVRLSLEQLPARGEDLDQLASLLPGGQQALVQPPPIPTELADLLSAARLRLQGTAETLALPGDVAVVGLELATTDAGGTVLRLFYAAAEPLQRQAEEMLHRQLTTALELPELDLRFAFVSTDARALTGAPGDTLALREIADILAERPGLSAELLVPPGMEAGRDAATDWFAARGVLPERIRVRAEPGEGVRVRLLPTRTE